METLGFQRPAHGVGMHVQLRGNGAHLPVFGMEQMADLGFDFRGNHGSFSRGKGLTHEPSRPQRQQHSSGGGPGPENHRSGSRTSASGGGFAGGWILA